MANETIQLAEYAAGLRYDDLPADVVQRAKDCITDTVAVIVQGSALPWSQIIIRYAQSIGTGGRSRVLGSTGPLLRAPAAALANGTLAEEVQVDQWLAGPVLPNEERDQRHGGRGEGPHDEG